MGGWPCIGLNRNAAPLVLPAGSVGQREQPESPAVLPAALEPGRADRAAVHDPRADPHSFRVHRAHDLRARRVAAGTADAPKRTGAMSQLGLPG